jgi:hypothetical protein
LHQRAEQGELQDFDALAAMDFKKAQNHIYHSANSVSRVSVGTAPEGMRDGSEFGRQIAVPTHPIRGDSEKASGAR